MVPEAPARNCCRNQRDAFGFQEQPTLQAKLWDAAHEEKLVVSILNLPTLKRGNVPIRQDLCG